MQGFAFKSLMIAAVLGITSLSSSWVFANTCMACHQGETVTTTANESQNSQHDGKKKTTQESAGEQEVMPE